MFIQWLYKTFFFFGSIVTIITGLIYFIDGGKLIDNGAVPLASILYCLFIPMGTTVLVFATWLIKETEKEIDTESEE